MEYDNAMNEFNTKFQRSSIDDIQVWVGHPEYLNILWKLWHFRYTWHFIRANLRGPVGFPAVGTTLKLITGSQSALKLILYVLENKVKARTFYPLVKASWKYWGILNIQNIHTDIGSALKCELQEWAIGLYIWSAPKFGHYTEDVHCWIYWQHVGGISDTHDTS